MNARMTAVQSLFITAQRSAVRFVSLRTFFKGMGAVIAIYAALLIYVLMQADITLTTMQTRLDTATVSITKPEKPAEAAPEPLHDTPKEIHKQAHEDKTEAPELYLPPAPIPSVYESTQNGGLPRIADTGLTPFTAYKRPFIDSQDPYIAIILTGYGLSAKTSQQALERLPPGITLALSPYADTPKDWQKKARTKGHELWLSLPLQTARYPADDPGALGLMSHAGLKQNRNKLFQALSTVVGYSGVVAATDNAFAQNKSVLRAITSEVFNRGLGFAELNTRSKSPVANWAQLKKAVYGQSMASLDDTSLKEIERMARRQKHVIVSATLTPKIIETLATWTATLPEKSIALAPLSAPLTKPDQNKISQASDHNHEHH